jgi:thioesterase domain-containing protein
MAQQLRRSGEDVEVVLLIDARARNAPYRWIHRAVGLAGRVGVLRPEAQRARFARLREIIERLPQGTGPRLRHVLAKSVSPVGRWLHGVEDVPPPEAPEPAVPDRRTAQWHEYNDALEHYVAARHPGPLVLFRSSHLLTRPPGGEAAGWDRVTPRLDVHWLPGNHRECITRHVGVLADRMKPYLAA